MDLEDARSLECMLQKDSELPVMWDSNGKATEREREVPKTFGSFVKALWAQILVCDHRFEFLLCYTFILLWSRPSIVSHHPYPLKFSLCAVPFGSTEHALTLQ